jgi:hypothetical protein
MIRFLTALIVALGVVTPTCCCLAATEAPQPKVEQHDCCKGDVAGKADRHDSGKACECGQQLKSAPMEKTATLKAVAPVDLIVARPVPVSLSFSRSAAFVRSLPAVDDPPGASVPLHQRLCIYLV